MILHTVTLFHMCLNYETKSNFARLWHIVDETFDGSWGFRRHEKDAFSSWVLTCIFICIFCMNSFQMCLARWKLRSNYVKWFLFSFSHFGLTYLIVRWIWMMPIFLKVSWFLLEPAQRVSWLSRLRYISQFSCTDTDCSEECY